MCPLCDPRRSWCPGCGAADWRMVVSFLLLLASCIALLALTGCNEDASPTPESHAVSTPGAALTGSRSGLLWCYYGTIDGQVGETKDHANCQWAGPWGLVSNIPTVNVGMRLQEAREANAQCVILEVPTAYSGEAETRDYFATLDRQGLIDGRICALYPLDEPDYNGKSAEQIASANAMVRRVAAEFPFTPHIPLAVIYTAGGGFPGIGSYDWVGFDDYSKGTDVLSNGTWNSLKAALRADQRVLLVPGAAWCVDIEPFYRKAQDDLQVVAVIPFIWFDNWDKPGNKGLTSQPCRQAYVDAATRIKNPTH